MSGIACGFIVPICAAPVMNPCWPSELNTRHLFLICVRLNGGVCLYVNTGSRVAFHPEKLNGLHEEGYLFLLLFASRCSGVNGGGIMPIGGIGAAGACGGPKAWG